MRFSIDVVFLKKNTNSLAKIIFIKDNMTPWKMSPIIWSANAVLELPAGVVKKYKLSEGEEIALWDLN